MKKLWQRLPRLSRKWKIVRNTVFVLLTALLLPAALGWPALTQDGALAKMQGKYLLSPSEILYRTRRGDTQGYLLQGEGWVAAGRVEKYDNTSRPLERDVPMITQVLDREMPGILVIPAQDKDGATVLAAFGGPEEAAQAELTLEVAAVEPDYGIPGGEWRMSSFTAGPGGMATDIIYFAFFLMTTRRSGTAPWMRYGCSCCPREMNLRGTVIR